MKENTDQQKTITKAVSYSAWISLHMYDFYSLPVDSMCLEILQSKFYFLSVTADNK